MGRFILGLIGVVLSALLIKYREKVGDAFGDPPWASKVGGMYNVVIILGAIGFFWSLSYMSNTQDILFAPILSFFPGMNKPAGGGVPFNDF